MRKDDEKIKELEEYLTKTQKSAKLDKLSERIRVLINYYKGMSNSDNAKEHNISIRTINRWVNRYKKGQNHISNYDYTGRIPKINEEQIEEIETALENNPLKLGLNYSIWNGSLLKRYIKNLLNIEVSKIYCENLLSNSKTIFKASNYDASKNNELIKIINELIMEYESDSNYSVWYFDTYYFGRNILKDMNITKKEEDEDNKKKKEDKDDPKKKEEELERMLKGNDIYKYEKYIIYGFYNLEAEWPFEYDIKSNINKETFIDIVKEFVNGKKQELNENTKVMLIMESNNVFKSIMTKDIEAKVIFLPKNLANINKINSVWNKIRKSSFSIIEKPSRRIQDEFEILINKIFQNRTN